MPRRPQMCFSMYYSRVILLILAAISPATRIRNSKKLWNFKNVDFIRAASCFGIFRGICIRESPTFNTSAVLPFFTRGKQNWAITAFSNCSACERLLPAHRSVLSFPVLNQNRVHGIVSKSALMRQKISIIHQSRIGLVTGEEFIPQGDFLGIWCQYWTSAILL